MYTYPINIEVTYIQIEKKDYVKSFCLIFFHQASRTMDQVDC